MSLQVIIIIIIIITISIVIIIIIIITYSVLRHGNSPFQSELSRECGLVLALSSYNITSFPQGHM